MDEWFVGDWTIFLSSGKGVEEGLSLFKTVPASVQPLQLVVFPLVAVCHLCTLHLFFFFFCSPGNAYTLTLTSFCIHLFVTNCVDLR